MSKFKVGDRVQENCSSHKMIGTIRRYDKNIIGEWLIDWDIGLNKDVHYRSSDLEKIEDESKQCWAVSPEMFFDEAAESININKYINQAYDLITRQGYIGNWDYQELETSTINESMTQKLSKTMSSIIKKMKDIKLSQEDRLLRKHDFENDNGIMTFEAKEMMSDELLEERWAKRRLEIAADLKLVEQSEK